MKRHRVNIDPGSSESLPKGRVDEDRLNSTTEEDIARQQYFDEQEELNEVADFTRRVRKRLGLSQEEFSRRIDVPVETIRNWEHGKKFPTGAAKALLKILDKYPETAISALS